VQNLFCIFHLVLRVLSEAFPVRSTLFQMRSTDTFKSAPHKRVNESKVRGSTGSLAAHARSRYVTSTTHAELYPKTSSDSCTIRSNSHNCNTGDAALDGRNLNGLITHTMVVVWKRTMHALRRESSRDSESQCGVLTCRKFTMTILRSRKKPWSTSESGASREASLADSVYADAGSAWSLV